MTAPTGPDAERAVKEAQDYMNQLCHGATLEAAHRLWDHAIEAVTDETTKAALTCGGDGPEPHGDSIHCQSCLEAVKAQCQAFVLERMEHWKRDENERIQEIVCADCRTKILEQGKENR